MKHARREDFAVPAVVDRSAFQAELAALRLREKAWHDGHPAAEQCEGCTFFTTQVRELSHLHVRDVTYATFCQGPYAESLRYRDFMGWEMPWYSALDSLDTLPVGREVGLMYLVCYLRQGSKLFETYWTTRRGVEGRQELWEDSPKGWPQRWEGKQRMRTDGRPISQWTRVKAGHSDDLRTGGQ